MSKREKPKLVEVTLRLDARTVEMLRLVGEATTGSRKPSPETMAEWLLNEWAHEKRAKMRTAIASHSPDLRDPTETP
jgi:hypothetical protein